MVALPAPTEREKSQMYMQRYMAHFPGAGEVVIFDRSWYNRAGVERVMGFTSDEQVERFLQLTPEVEQAMVDAGIILLKYWLEVSEEEQTRRISAGSTTVARRGSSRRWTSSPTAVGMTIRLPATTMFAATDTSVGAVVRGRLERQEASPSQHHQPFARRDPLSTNSGEEGAASQTARTG